MWKPSYNMTHNTVSQSLSIALRPGDGDIDGLGEAGRDKDRFEKPALEVQGFLLHSCYSRSVVTKADRSVPFSHGSWGPCICLRGQGLPVIAS